jgi:hypothetical protein
MAHSLSLDIDKVMIMIKDKKSEKKRDSMHAVRKPFQQNPFLDFVKRYPLPVRDTWRPRTTLG